ncbi:hypothetical protein D3C85_978720 [compost metagenome]
MFASPFLIILYHNAPYVETLFHQDFVFDLWSVIRRFKNKTLSQLNTYYLVLNIKLFPDRDVCCLLLFSQ